MRPQIPIPNPQSQTEQSPTRTIAKQQKHLLGNKMYWRTMKMLFELLISGNVRRHRIEQRAHFSSLTTRAHESRAHNARLVHHPHSHQIK